MKSRDTRPEDVQTARERDLRTSDPRGDVLAPTETPDDPPERNGVEAEMQELDLGSDRSERGQRDGGAGRGIGFIWPNQEM